jgi:hypothetical protein
MLVSHRKKFIYTKTMKTAGTSVEVYFEPHCMKEGEWSFAHGRDEYVSDDGIIGCRTASNLTIQGATWWNHMPAVVIKNLLGEAIWDSYFKFCVVRDPFDKLVSAFHYFNPTISFHVNLRQNFEKWLGSGELPVDRNKYTIQGEFCMDDVIRYETLTQDLQRICQKLNVTFRLADLPRLKNGSRPQKPLKDYYSKSGIEIVQQFFHYELEKFGYSPPA